MPQRRPHELELFRTLIDRLELEFGHLAARFAQSYDEGVLLNPTPVSWMRDNLHMTSHAAATAVHVGMQARRLQNSCAALADGRIGFAHLGLIAGLADSLEQSPTATVAAFDERSLLRKAERLSVQSFRTACAHVRHAADREGFLADQLAGHEARSLVLRCLGGGALELHGFLDREAGTLLRTILDPLARPRPDDSRSREHRYADALAELCQQTLEEGLIPQSGGQRPHLQVTATVATLRDLRGAAAGEMEHAGPVAVSTVRRLACDATITRVLLDAESAVIDVGRSQRVVSGATRRALNIRDRGCRWPGCGSPPSRTQAHHIRHWADHGATDLSNLVRLQ